MRGLTRREAPVRGADRWRGLGGTGRFSQLEPLLLRAGDRPREEVVKILSALLVVLGLAVVVRTAVAGGGVLAVGYVLGILLVLAGGLRLYLSRH